MRGNENNSTEGNNVYSDPAFWHRNFVQNETRYTKDTALCYWHEYLYILFLFKAARKLRVTEADILPKQVDKVNLVMNLRTTNNSLTTYDIPKTHAIPMPSPSCPLRRKELAISNGLTNNSKRMTQTCTWPKHYN